MGKVEMDGGRGKGGRERKRRLVRKEEKEEGETPETVHGLHHTPWDTPRTAMGDGSLDTKQ